MSAIAPAIRVLAALRAGAVLVGRPRGVVHVYSGPLTRSGGAPRHRAAPFCGTRSRRLRVLGRADDLGNFPGTGRRFCRSCTRRLPAALGVDNRPEPGARDEWVEAYSALTIADLHLAATWCRTVEETHQVGRLLLMVHGPKPLRPATYAEHALRAAHDTAEHRRRFLANRDLTPEQRAALVARREAEAADRQRVNAGRRRADRIARATDKQNAGKYLMPHERELLASG